MFSIGSGHGPRVRVANALAVLSFFIFAAAVLSLHQERSIPFPIEENGDIPVALSHFRFGAPRGLVDSSLTNLFWRKLNNLPADEAIERALNDIVEPVYDWAPVTDGNGIGGIVMVRAAFALFGVHARALPYFFVLVLGLSAAAFIFRYQDKRIFAVPVLFAAFTALILTPMSSPVVAAQVPLGGIRSYSIVGILAALHWCFELTRGQNVSHLSEKARWLLLSVQIAVLGFAVLVRGSPAYLLGPVTVVGIYYLLRNWGTRGRRMMLLRLIVPTVAMVAALSSIAPLAFPEYAEAGRAHGVIWHRVFISLGYNPAWPFAGVQEKYPCPEIPEGLRAIGGDRNGHCMWWAYAHKHGLSTDQVIRGVYGGQYEGVMRSAVLDVALTYPRETFETFFRFKTWQMLDNARHMLNMQADRLTLIAVLVILQMTIVVIFLVAWPIHKSLLDAAYSACFVLIFLIFAVVPQLVAWALPATAIDFIAYLLCAGIISCWLVFAALATAVVNLAPARWRARVL